MIILRDITAAKQLEQQVMTVADGERQRIGQDLHDDLCPQLIGIQGLCAVLAQNLTESGSGEAPLVQKIVPCIDDAIRKARGLCPVYLVAHGFTAALEAIVRETQETSGITCRFSAACELDLWDNTVATHLFYIAREAVANAVKHAHAGEISVSLLRRGNSNHLRIVDNGGGFSLAGATRGMGLPIMRQRAKMIGAIFELESTPGGGTTIQLAFNVATSTRESQQP